MSISKFDNKEVDFIATKTDKKKYIQVTESTNAPENQERELHLRKIPYNYEKIVIVIEFGLPQDQDGIKIVGTVDFLLGEWHKKLAGKPVSFLFLRTICMRGIQTDPKLH